MRLTNYINLLKYPNFKNWSKQMLIESACFIDNTVYLLSLGFVQLELFCVVYAMLDGEVWGLYTTVFKNDD